MRPDETNEVWIRLDVIDLPDIRLFKKLFQVAGDSTSQKKDVFRMRVLQERQVNPMFGAKPIRFRK